MRQLRVYCINAFFGSAMSVKTRDQFVSLLNQSQIASHEMVALWTQGVDSNCDSQTIAKHLVNNGHLTAWQAKQFLAGKYKIKFGNQVLLEQVSKNELGTRYRAKHVKLGRLVSLFFIDKKMSDKLAQRPELIRGIAKTANFVHTSLEHLHVIEHESGRLMLVTDYVNGRTLNDPDLLVELTGKDVPKILSQCFSAIAAAHAQGLYHGAIADSDICIDAERNATIQNIVLSFLVHNLSADNDIANHTWHDIDALIRIGQRLVKRLVKNNDYRSFFESVFQQMAQRALLPAEAANKISKQFALAGRNVSNEETKPLASRKPDQRLSQPLKKPRSSPWWIHATITLCLLVALFIVYWSGWFGSATPIANQTETTETQLELPDMADAPGAQGQGLTPVSEGPGNSRERQDNAESDLPHLATDSATPAIEQTDSDVAAETRKETKHESTPAPEADSTTDQQETESREDASALWDRFKTLTEDHSEDSIPASTEPGENDNVKKPQPEVKASNVKLPKFVDLLNNETTTIGPIRNGRLDLTLITDSNSTPEKTTFSLTGDVANGWRVNVQDDGKRSHVAQLKFVNDTIQFRWENNPPTENAKFLSNGVLKIDNADDVAYVSLRKPLAIQGFKLDRAKPQIKIQVPTIPFPPNDILVQLDELSEAQFGDVYINNEDRQFSRKKPLVLHFSDLPEYKMLFLELSADLKKKHRVEAELKLQLDPFQKARLAEQKSLEATKQLFESKISETKQRHDYLKNTPIDQIRAQFKLSSDVYKNQNRNAQVKELKQQLELIENQFKTFRETLSKIEPFYQASIPVTLFCMVNGQRVVLASSKIE